MCNGPASQMEDRMWADDGTKKMQNAAKRKQEDEEKRVKEAQRKAEKQALLAKVRPPALAKSQSLRIHRMVSQEQAELAKIKAPKAPPKIPRVRFRSSLRSCSVVHCLHPCLSLLLVCASGSGRDSQAANSGTSRRGGQGQRFGLLCASPRLHSNHKLCPSTIRTSGCPAGART